jgi:DNA polymerase delta subunit 2
MKLRCFEYKLTEPGVIMAALGMETHNGDFEVIDVCFAGVPEIYQPEAGPSNVKEPETKGKGKAKAETQAHDSEMDEGEFE